MIGPGRRHGERLALVDPHGERADVQVRVGRGAVERRVDLLAVEDRLPVGRGEREVRQARLDRAADRQRPGRRVVAGGAGQVQRPRPDDRRRPVLALQERLQRRQVGHRDLRDVEVRHRPGLGQRQPRHGQVGPRQRPLPLGDRQPHVAGRGRLAPAHRPGGDRQVLVPQQRLAVVGRGQVAGADPQRLVRRPRPAGVGQLDDPAAGDRHAVRSQLGRQVHVRPADQLVDVRERRRLLRQPEPGRVAQPDLVDRQVGPEQRPRVAVDVELHVGRAVGDVHRAADRQPRDRRPPLRRQEPGRQRRQLPRQVGRHVQRHLRRQPAPDAPGQRGGRDGAVDRQDLPAVEVQRQRVDPVDAGRPGHVQRQPDPPERDRPAVGQHALGPHVGQRRQPRRRQIRAVGPQRQLDVEHPVDVLLEPGGLEERPQQRELERLDHQVQVRRRPGRLDQPALDHVGGPLHRHPPAERLALGRGPGQRQIQVQADPVLDVVEVDHLRRLPQRDRGGQAVGAGDDERAAELGGDGAAVGGEVGRLGARLGDSQGAGDVVEPVVADLHAGQVRVDRRVAEVQVAADGVEQGQVGLGRVDLRDEPAVGVVELRAADRRAAGPAD